MAYDYESILSTLKEGCSEEEREKNGWRLGQTHRRQPCVYEVAAIWLANVGELITILSASQTDCIALNVRSRQLHVSKPGSSLTYITENETIV